MSERGNWQGMLTIARFNWPFYVAAGAVLLTSLFGMVASSSLAVRIICGLTLAGSAYFVFGSLGVSHLIYDRSDLYRWDWLARALHGVNQGRFIFCHAGFDETSQVLREKFPTVEWQVIDHFDETWMTEASIRRARQMFPPTPGTTPAAFDQWKVEAASADLVLGILAIHELRTETQRTAWCAEAKRCLRSDGRVVLVEHVRDLANFVAFGPGFLHFHSRASWRRCWEAAGLRCADEFRVTLWVRIFVLRK